MPAGFLLDFRGQLALDWATATLRTLRLTTLPVDTATGLSPHVTPTGTLALTRATPVDTAGLDRGRSNTYFYVSLTAHQ